MRRKKVAELAIGVILVTLIGIWFRGCLPPSQRSLVRNFQRHRDSFERMLVMLDEDSAATKGVDSRGVRALSVARSYRADEERLSDERYRQYCGLLRRAGAYSVSRRSDETRFLVARSGFGSHGWGVAIVHRTTAPKDVIASLSDFRPDGTSSGTNTAYCLIADGWYIWIAW